MGDNSLKKDFEMYNLDYLENMYRMYSKTAENICKIRWKFIESTNSKTVLDYGCGCGFFRMYRPKKIIVDSYDVNDYCVQTGINRNQYDLICLWDVLEHINIGEVGYLLDKTKYLALSIPIKPDDINMITWKHYKPGEHIFHYTEKLLNETLEKYNFKQIKKGQPECPPRKDIRSFIYEKVNS